MHQAEVFGLALGLPGTPWKVVGVDFDPELKRLNLRLDFPPGSRFPHPETAESLSGNTKTPRNQASLRSMIRIMAI